MRLLACTETVTLVRHAQTPAGDSYSPEAIHGVSWYEKIENILSSPGEDPSASVIVRIPADVAPAELPVPGDYLIRGLIPPRVSLDPGILAQLSAFRISKVGNNLRVHLPHVVVSCK